MTHRLIIIVLLASASATAAVPTLAQTRPAAQATQPVNRTAFIQRIDRDFVAADTNKDGFADRAELEVAHTRVQTQRKAQIIRGREAAFRRLDTNKDGMLTLQEFNAVVVATPLPRSNVTQILNRFDTNKDGRVSHAENRAPAVARFDRADTNKDGTISANERARAAAARTASRN